MSREMADGDIFMKKFFVNKVVINLHMLGSSMIDQIISQGNSSHVVILELWRNRERHLKFSEKNPEPVQFCDSDGEGVILSFDAGGGDHGLFFGLPRDETGAQEDAIAPCDLRSEGSPAQLES
jgi:hypothetical protein